MKYFILNDELKSSCDFDPSQLRLGPNIYELIRIIDAKPLFIEAHIDRFYQSALFNGIQLNFEPEYLLIRIKNLIESNHLRQANIRFQYNISTSGTALFHAWITPFYYPSIEQSQQGVKLGLFTSSRENPQAKSAFLAARQEADAFLENKDIFEVLLVRQNELISEGSRSNIFFIKDDRVITPEASLILEGITRKYILQLFQDHGIEVEEGNIYKSELKAFDAAFLSGTSLGVLPISDIDDIPFDSGHPLIKKISRLYLEKVELYIKEFSWTPAKAK